MSLYTRIKGAIKKHQLKDLIPEGHQEWRNATSDSNLITFSGSSLTNASRLNMSWEDVYRQEYINIPSQLTESNLEQGTIIANRFYQTIPYTSSSIQESPELTTTTNNTGWYIINPYTDYLNVSRQLSQQWYGTSGTNGNDGSIGQRVQQYYQSPTKRITDSLNTFKNPVEKYFTELNPQVI